MAKFLEAPQDLYAPLLDEAYKRRMAVAQQLMRAREQAGTGSVPVGIAQLGTAAIEGLVEKKARDDALDQQNQYFDAQGKNIESGIAALAAALKGGAGAGGETADAGSTDKQGPIAGANPDGSAASGSRFRDAIASIESGGRYDAIGPTNEKLGRALGKYQVMEANIGPWSKEALGREVTPDEFLKNPQIQDKIFDTQFAKNIQRYGSPEQAASVWFTGRPITAASQAARDSLGTSGSQYVNRFSQALGMPGGGAPAPTAQTQGPSGSTAQQAQAVLQNPGAYDPRTVEWAKANSGGPVQVASNDPSIGAGSAQPQAQAPGGVQMAQADAVPSPEVPAQALPPQAQRPAGIDPASLVPNFQQRMNAIRQLAAHPNPNVKMLAQKQFEQLQNDVGEAVKLAQQKRYELQADDYKHSRDRRETVGDKNTEMKFQANRDTAGFAQQNQLEDRKSANDIAGKREEHRLSAMDPTGDIKEYQYYSDQAKAAGQPVVPFRQWQIDNKRAGATIIDQRAQNAEDQARGAGLGKRLNEIADDGVKAQDDMAVVQRMQGLFNNVEPGAKTAALEALRGMTGITLDPNTDNVQAARSIVDYLTPRMRVAGSGSSSDKDMNAFKGAMPQLLATPGGNDLVIGTLGGMHQLRLERAKIAEMWQAGDITGKEASQRIRDLDKMDPFAKFKEWQSAQKSDQPGSVTTTEQPPVPNARKAGDGNWYVPDPNRPGKYLKVQ